MAYWHERAMYLPMYCTKSYRMSKHTPDPPGVGPLMENASVAGTSIDATSWTGANFRTAYNRREKCLHQDLAVAG